MIETINPPFIRLVRHHFATAVKRYQLSLVDGKERRRY